MKFILLLFIGFISFGSIAQECDVTVFEAYDVVGQEVVVCGVVMQVATPQGIRGNPTYINMGARFPNHPFTVVIWGSDADKFVRDTDSFIRGLKSFEGKRIAVSGLVEEYRGKPQIVVKDPEQIVVLEEKGN